MNTPGGVIDSNLISMNKKEVKGSLLLLLFSFVCILSLILISSSFVSAAICGGNVPCNCGDTITSSRTLNESDVLTNCPNDGSSGLIIGADNVILNCAGYKINQSYPDGGSAINNQGYDNITIKNCILENFYRTILFQGSANSGTIYNNTINNSSGYGLDMEQGPNYNNISSNVISNSEYMGIFLHQAAFNQVENNYVVGGDRGIQITTSSDSNVVINNTFCRNSVWDIEFTYGVGDNNTGDNTCNSLYPYGTNDVTCSKKCEFMQGICANIMVSNITLTKNITSCSDKGLIIGDENLTLDCNGYSIQGEGSYGIYNNGHSSTNIRNCNIFDFSWGIFYNVVSGGEISYNNVSRGGYGLGLASGSNIQIHNNRLIEGSGSGIALTDSSLNNTIYDNVAAQNGYQGLNIEGFSSSNNITNNDFCFNAADYYYDVLFGSMVQDNYGSNLFGPILDDSNGANPNFIKNESCVTPDFVQGQCTQVVGSNITLTEDILGCTSVYVLRIYANDVTIDCNGHVLSGFDKGGYGIKNTKYNGTTIKNCIFDDFSYAAYFYTTGVELYNITFDNNTFRNSDNGIYAAYFLNSTIKDNNFSFNSESGIDLESDSYYNTIVNNNFDNNWYGLYLSESSHNNLSYNNFTNNYYAIDLDESSDNNLILDSNFTSNTYGFYLNYADNNEIGRNYVDSSSKNFGDSSFSCPFLYSWNGSSYDFVTDLSGRGTLGILQGTSYKKPYPNGYAKINSNQLQQKEGNYLLQITQEYNEIPFIDSIQIISIDHSSDVDIYPGYGITNTSHIFSVSKNPRIPLSCITENGVNCLTEISNIDESYTHQNNSLELDLGNLSGKESIKLIINKIINTSSVSKSVMKLEVKDSGNNWVNVFADSNDLAVASTTPNTYVLNLSGKFLTEDYRVKLTFPAHYFDYIAVDTTPEENLIIKTVNLSSADLHYRGYSNLVNQLTHEYDYNNLVKINYKQSSGNFTKYGEVSSLLESVDDEFVILNHGDEMTLNLSYVPLDNDERDFIIHSNVFYKPQWRANGTTVNPLPFQDMSNYPYPSNERYPSDLEHQTYLNEYNTRELAPKIYGGSLPYSRNNTVFDNTIVATGMGVIGLYLYYEIDTQILNNVISGELGIQLDYSSGTIISRNNVTTANFPIYIFDSSESNEITNNILNTSSNSCIYFEDGSTSNSILHNTFIGDVWVDDDDGANSYNDSYSGNIYYLSNGSFSWSFYNLTDLDDDGWADSGDVPFNSSRAGIGENVLNTLYGADPSNQYGIGDWVDSGSVIDYDNSTGSVPSGETPAHLQSGFTNSDGAKVISATFIVYSGTGKSEFEVPTGCLLDTPTTQIFSYGAEYGNYLNITCQDVSGPYVQIGVIEGTSQLNEVEMNITYSPSSYWRNYGEDWHPAALLDPSIRRVVVDLISPSYESNLSSPINFIYNVGVGWAGQEINYCNLSVTEERTNEISVNEFDGLLALWHFNNDLTDSSGNGNNGIEGEGEFSSDYKIGDAGYYFNGNEGIVHLADDSVFNSIDNFTVSTWIKLNAFSSYSSITAFGNGGDEFLFYTNGNGQVCFYRYGCGDSYLYLNKWYHIAAVREASSVYFYIDGVLDGSAEGSSDTITLLSGFRALGSDDSSEKLNGYLDEFAIWNRALTAEEIHTLYAEKYISSSSSINLDQNNSLSLNLGLGNYTWDVSCTDNLGLIGTSETRSFTVNGQTTEELSEANSAAQQTSSSGYAPQTYFGDNNLPRGGNNFNLRYHDRINFTVNFTNHTLTLNQFNSTTAEVLIQSEPIIAYLQKGVLYEFDVNKDGITDTMIRYDGPDRNLARIFIQEILPKKSLNLETTESSKTNWICKKTTIFYKILISIIILGIVVILILHKYHRKKRYSRYGY